MAAQFKVRRPGEAETMDWGEFCHGPTPGDHARLHARLTIGAKPGHPVAIYGRITAAEQDGEKRPVLRLADGHGFTVRIRSDHPSPLNPLKVGAYVLAVGAWAVWKPHRGRPELRMFAKEHWQLAHWNYDTATGHSGQPACPPPLSLAQRALRQAGAAAAKHKPAPGRAARLSPRRHPSGPPTSAAPPEAASPAVPPSAPAAPSIEPSPGPPTPTPPPGPAVPDTTPPAEPKPPAHPPLPLRPPAPPRPAVPPLRRTRRSWWPFGRRR
ncbi:hypothetical protein ABT126_40250 [Streptomyces sp. NPDC002012]|uniref:hypothetical protein n=1 Tax=Streptomyces sp. NPDC002012 TaxID=3154532 RepID=UPI0033257376